MKKLVLVSALCIFARIGFSQCYTVSQITYAPDSFNTGTPLILTDDQYSDLIAIPFSFCFYGSSYSQLVIGSNGVVSFNTSVASTVCPWPIQMAIPSYQNPLNSIFFPFQDLHPDYPDTLNPRIFYATYGTAPNRRFVISYYHSPMHGCLTTMETGEVILFETSNAIEMHIQQKNACSWNGGYAIMGIQNANAQNACVVPGRNFPSQWTAFNDAWRFTSNCCNVGIPFAEKNSSLQLFPNPASAEFHLTYLNGNHAKFSVELIDLTGRIIYSDNLSDEMERTIHFDASAGIYFVRLIGETGEVLSEKKLTIE